jgi:hypothetical protein
MIGRAAKRAHITADELRRRTAQHPNARGGRVHQSQQRRSDASNKDHLEGFDVFSIDGKVFRPMLSLLPLTVDFDD